METEELICFNNLKSLYIPKPKETTHIPKRLIYTLGQAGFALSEEAKGKITPEDEDRLLKSLSGPIQQIWGGREDVWNTVWISPEDVPKSVYEQMDQRDMLYASPGCLKKLHEGKEHNLNIWGKNNWKISGVIGISGDDDLREFIRKEIVSPIPLKTYSYLSWILDNRMDLIPQPLDKITCKETLSLFLSRGFGEESVSGVSDILMSAENSSNSSVMGKFVLSKKIRKNLLDLLEKTIKKKGLRNCLSDAKPDQRDWKHFARYTHPSPASYPLVFEFFGKLRGHIQGWWGRVQQDYDRKDYPHLIKTLSERPTILLRRFDSLFRKFGESGDTENLGVLIDTFLEKSKDMSVKSILQLCRYYDRRSEELPRSFVGSGGIRYTYESLPKMDEDLINFLQETFIGCLKKIWRGNLYEGKKVKVDLGRGIEIPVSLKSGNEGETLKTFSGDLINFETEGMVRFFTQWIDPIGNEDLDLHAFLWGGVGKELVKIDFNESFSDKAGFVRHSGDIRHIVGNCAEYVTVDFTKGDIPYEWMLVVVNNYEEGDLKSLENYLGFSNVTGNNCGGHWVPSESSTLYRTRVASECSTLIGFMVNLKKGVVKVILEGLETEKVLDNSVEDYLSFYSISPSLDLKRAIEIFVTENGGTITDVENPDLTITKGDVKDIVSKMLEGKEKDKV